MAVAVQPRRGPGRPKGSKNKPKDANGQVIPLNGDGEGQTESLDPKQRMAVARTAQAFASYGEARKSMAKIARAIVNLRLTFVKDGRPDFRGDTPQYRGAIASLYEAAIPDPDERESFKVAIRYWVAKEFQARVDNGSLTKRALNAAGLGQPAATPTRPRQQQESPEEELVDFKELPPEEALGSLEEVIAERVADETLGIIMAMQSLNRTLGPIVAGLREGDTASKLPGRSLKAASKQLLNLAIDAAVLSGVDVMEFTQTWFEENSQPSRRRSRAAA